MCPLANFDLTNRYKRDVNKREWDDTFFSRLPHFFKVTDPFTLLVSKEKLCEARKIALRMQKGCRTGVSKEDEERAMKLYQSAFNAETGEYINVFGRLASLVPCSAAIGGLLVHYYRTNAGVIACQVIAQSYYSFFNYSNRNSETDMTLKQRSTAFLSATAAGVFVALAMKIRLNRWPRGLLWQRTVPFVGLSASYVANVTVTRYKEIVERLPCYDEEGNFLTVSRFATLKSHMHVIASRIFMMAPPMILIPHVLEKMERKSFMRSIRLLHLPIKIAFFLPILLVTVPAGLSLFPYRGYMTFDRLLLFDRYQNENYKNAYGELHFPYYIFFSKGY